MEISACGYTCFRITERGYTSVLTDPWLAAGSLADSRWKTDLATLSRRRSGAQLEGLPAPGYLITGPGEYEIGELFVTGIPLHGHDAEKDRLLDNVAYHFEYPNNLKLLHLGGLRRRLEQADIEQLDQVNALLLPLASDVMSGDEMADLIKMIEPNVVVPMQPPGASAKDYEAALDGFVKAMGSGSHTPQESLRLTPSNMPEPTQVALLAPSQAAG